MNELHVVCRRCGTRWMAEKQPRECQDDPACEAGWMELPQFVEKDVADACWESLRADNLSEQVSAASDHAAEVVEELRKLLDAIYDNVSMPAIVEAAHRADDYLEHRGWHTARELGPDGSPRQNAAVRER